MNGRSSDYLLVPRPSQQRQAVQWPTDIQDCSGGSQQRDCPGLPPGSLFIRAAGEPHRNQFAAKLRIIFDISLGEGRNFSLRISLFWPIFSLFSAKWGTERGEILVFG